MQRVLNLIGPDGSKKVARRLLNAGAKVGMTLGYMVRPRMVLWVSGPWLALSPQNIRESNERKTGWAQDAGDQMRYYPAQYNERSIAGPSIESLIE